MECNFDMKKFPDDKLIQSGWIESEDPTCAVVCECGHGVNSHETLWVSDDEIIRCPKCGKGYKTEFVVWQFEKDEGD